MNIELRRLDHNERDEWLSKHYPLETTLVTVDSSNHMEYYYCRSCGDIVGAYEPDHCLLRHYRCAHYNEDTVSKFIKGDYYVKL